MSIEIKQLHIKSSIVQRASGSNSGNDRQAMQPEQALAIKEELLAECRSLILDVLRNMQER